MQDRQTLLCENSTATVRRRQQLNIRAGSLRWLQSLLGRNKEATAHTCASRLEFYTANSINLLSRVKKLIKKLCLHFIRH
jgi:predicted transcriptional regulator